MNSSPYFTNDQAVEIFGASTCVMSLLKFLPCLLNMAQINEDCHPQILRALFTEDQRDSPSELAFKYSVYRINKDKTLLANTTLVYDIQHVPKDDSFHAAKKVVFKPGLRGVLLGEAPKFANGSYL
ncbi:glutamate receptor ionotropic: kainate 2-like protein [Nephila pilipes]|uniref:Glutamate receptor ionotropic: kainate 2-like protein n=1 Tax=Nephila pilipes TaxID=299642 RepID=A0A8X6MQI2_NEPPI|nr:glutamate receptor ionotropic: kainate 2-like protein [Nephila pilipes]